MITKTKKTKMKTLIELTNRFAMEGQVSFYKKQELDIIQITNKHAQMDLSLYGAQVLSFIPNNEEDLLWMSSLSEFKQGKAIRGGIPLCFPWFGPHDSDDSLPQHGFARLSVWNLEEVKQLEDDRTSVTLTIQSSPDTKKYWPHEFYAELTVIVGKELEVNLTVNNTDSDSFKYTSALHTYLAVGDINNAKIEGLKNTEYYWGFEDTIQKQDDELLSITKEENRRYINTSNTCFIQNSLNNKTTAIDKKGSNVTVVWNPWQETCLQMKDVENEAYKSFVCVEAANYYYDYIVLKPGESHTTSTKIRLK
ncbi:D-hexose-6-phosphate mutarotase [Labilibacter sediminis]|nr:D-hexose-6-phosphate mutarotase [Labilibacter sediminis]